MRYTVPMMDTGEQREVSGVAASVGVGVAGAAGATVSTHRLTFLGTGASCGVPSFYCGCKACAEARREPRAARDCSGLLVSGSRNVLIDTAPELRTQLIREGVSDIAAVLYTHEHFDHLGGLPQLEFYVRLRSHTPLPVYAGAETLAAIGQRFGFMSDVLEYHLLEAGATVVLDGVGYTPLPAAHSAGAFGFLVEGASARVAYFPDTGPLPEGTAARLGELGRQGRLDVLALDATFNGANWMPATHHSIDEAVALIRTLGARQGYLTHLSMHYDEPITLAELEQKLASYQGSIAVAHDGLAVSI